MKKRQMPDPIADAAREAQTILQNREACLEAPILRVLADALWLERGALLEGLVAFHRERMNRIPSPTRYPESPPWVEYVLARDRELRQRAGLSDFDMAVIRSLHDYLAFRRLGHPHPAGDERCRVAFLPHSDHGRLHMKNLDDPATWWKPEPEPIWLYPRPDQTLFADGVGSGLHLDEEPPELFPLPVRSHMLHTYADDVPSAVEFLTRYRYFWGRANLLLFDRTGRSVAIEKCSFNFIEVFEPGPDGISHISGMTCRNPDSPQGRYQQHQREKYLRLYGQPLDGPDMAFWTVCRRFEEKLASGLAALAHHPTLDGLVRLFTRPWPEGLRKDGLRIHPQQGLIGYTLMSYVSLLDEGRLLRWQRSPLPELAWPDQPEEFHYPPLR